MHVTEARRASSSMEISVASSYSDSRRVNLSDLRKGKHNLAAVVAAQRGFYRVALKIDSLQVLEPAQLRLDLLKVGDGIMIRLSRKFSRRNK